MACGSVPALTGGELLIIKSGQIVRPIREITRSFCLFEIIVCLVVNLIVSVLGTDFDQTTSSS
jgi:hypothetical protein